jgi:hypothetical protein
MHVIHSVIQRELETLRPNFIYEKRKVTSANDLSFIVCSLSVVISVQGPVLWTQKSLCKFLSSLSFAR